MELMDRLMWLAIGVGVIYCGWAVVIMYQSLSL
jgi:hypothetical protein